MKEDLKFAISACFVCGAVGYMVNSFKQPQTNYIIVPNNTPIEYADFLPLEEEVVAEEPIANAEPKVTKKHRYKVSAKGKKFIKQMESCSLVAYWDCNGYSIGYGHHKDDIYEGMEITQEQADEYFEQDIKWVESAVNRYLNSLPYEYEFPQSFVDGLASFIYNTGEGGAKNSLFYERLNKCRVQDGVINNADYEFTLASIKSSRIFCKAHERRRVKEYNLMLAKI